MTQFFTIDTCHKQSIEEFNYYRRENDTTKFFETVSRVEYGVDNLHKNHLIPITIPNFETLKLKSPNIIGPQTNFN